MKIATAIFPANYGELWFTNHSLYAANAYPPNQLF